MTHFLPFLGENSLFHSIGEIFAPIFKLFGWVLAAIYGVTHNYAVSIIVLTVLIMLVLTPVTIKSTKSMIAMQRLQPEMKKLQAKYKGPENREALNAEMMKLYKENGTSPFGACLPSLLQMPFLIVLYSLIRGLSNTVKNGATYTSYVNGIAHPGTVCRTANVNGCAEPRHIPTTSSMYSNLVRNHGQMHSVFGMDLSSAPFTHHGANQALLTIPYLVLIGAAVFLQYYQMKQMNSRNPQAAAANPQMQTMQKFFPIIFGVIYLRVPAGATIYMVVSSAMRIGTQDIMFRTGMVTPVAAEREIGGGPKTPKTGTSPPKLGPSKAKAIGTGRRPTDGTDLAKGETAPKGTPAKGTAAKRPASKSTTQKKTPRPGGTTGANGNGKSGSNGRTPTNGKPPTNGKSSAAANGNADDDETPTPKEHPRSKAKKPRKAR